jgi:Uma2 family endonuclease
MQSVVAHPAPPDLEAWLERRRTLGQDRRDEMWDGVLHLNPGPSGPHAVLAAQLTVLLDAPARAAGLLVSADFNLGEHENQFRVPDLGIHRTSPAGVWIGTAAIVVEILSPGDETLDKLPYYAEREVDEVLIVDPAERRVQWLALAGSDYEQVQRSRVLELAADELAGRIDWPPAG